MSGTELRSRVAKLFALTDMNEFSPLESSSALITTPARQLYVRLGGKASVAINGIISCSKSLASWVRVLVKCVLVTTTCHLPSVSVLRVCITSKIPGYDLIFSLM